MFLFMNTLPKLMLSYVLSYLVKYTVVWIQTGSSSCSGDGVISSLVDLHLSAGDRLVCWGTAHCTCLFPHLHCPVIPRFGSHNLCTLRICLFMCEFHGVGEYLQFQSAFNGVWGKYPGGVNYTEPSSGCRVTRVTWKITLPGVTFEMCFKTAAISHGLLPLEIKRTKPVGSRKACCSCLVLLCKPVVAWVCVQERW